MQNSAKEKMIVEPASMVKVCAEAEVVVVGGGPGGIGAAVAAARSGAKTILVERYGHLGGMATGGLVILIPHMSDGSRHQQIGGICQEWLDRLNTLGGAVGPKPEDLGSSDKALVAHWRRYFSAVVDGTVRLSVYVDPELLKCALNDLVTEAGVKLYLHSWGCRAIVENGCAKGVIFESKSGRQAILGQVLIDATGDGDLFASAGVEFDGTLDRSLRSSQLALVFRLGNVDFDKFADFKVREPEKSSALLQELSQLAGFRMSPHPTPRNDVMWVNDWLIGYDVLNVEDLTQVELTARTAMLRVLPFLQKNVPGFENGFVLDTASQIGTRGSRRLMGEYIITGQDLRTGPTHPDTIAIFPSITHNTSPEHPHVHVPYRAILPRKIEGFLAAGRSFSSDPVANNTFNLIPHCVALGQAAGTAAALAVKNHVQPRQVNIVALQDCLRAQGVPLP
ncbi:MAG: FAD-dependent oxidoreductase [Chloroflexi bacterium]|nr:FAD-dependent oxidoreductase [Chloroflexota bacterium]